MNTSILIDISKLRVGMYIQLELGWLNHPFPVSSFKVSSMDQIDTLRSLGLDQIRYVPSKSDEFPQEPLAEATPVAPRSDASAPPPMPVEDAEALQRKAALKAQNETLALCDQRFGSATKDYQRVSADVVGDPGRARSRAEELVNGCVSDLLENGDSVIRLLSEGSGAHSALHAVNVMVLTLLLGKALGGKADELQDLGTAALLHDIGKVVLPSHIGEPHAVLNVVDRIRYEGHVGESVNLAKRMGLAPLVLSAIAHHHEMVDGTGFPQRLSGEAVSRGGQILALVNHYERMCNPLHGGDILTPHEALSVIFAQHKARFNPIVLGAFIRMMGVYPPGSIVQLVNDRYAIVASVNSSRPLRPRVIVHDPAVPKEEALVLDLESVPELGIRRSLKPSQLPRDALDYLSPRLRICYFFERAVDAGPVEGAS